MTRATNAGGSLSSMGHAPKSRRPIVDAPLIHRMKAKGLGAQHIAQQTGFSMEDVRRVLAPAPANDATPAAVPPTVQPERRPASGAAPRELTEADHRTLALVEKGEITQAAASAIMNCSTKTVRRCLERRADEAAERAA
ncbi:putative DNA-binding protein (UPF0251 family) [Brevundimonas bullata]|uniref:Putative DNA-binding protein (UPF0251 family) n=1 Tax=Brevundimonas bullata TaxID=13160 RepID=A0A7W7IP80_9CAUL|nr:hypothetical protein [Brevundimonas bullata]MBB4797993.1 putative DNA-binding protein (UPF0251 family) [Brevundimonas bullata]MBB6382952.1 putative DNA-binding protein (UPF0251 family) [Brevundimonas bullata]